MDPSGTNYGSPAPVGFSYVRPNYYAAASPVQAGSAAPGSTGSSTAAGGPSALSSTGAGAVTSTEGPPSSGGFPRTYVQSFTPTVPTSAATYVAPFYTPAPAGASAASSPYVVTAPSSAPPLSAPYSPYGVMSSPYVPPQQRTAFTSGVAASPLAGGAIYQSGHLSAAASAAAVQPPRSISFETSEGSAGTNAPPLTAQKGTEEAPQSASLSTSGARQTSPRSYRIEQLRPAEPGTPSTPNPPQSPQLPFTPAVAIPLVADAQINPPTEVASTVITLNTQEQAQPEQQPAARPAIIGSTVNSIEHCSSDPRHPSYVPPQRNIVALSSKRIPNRQDAARKSHLPLGMLISPLAPVQKPTSLLRRSAVACATCGGIINKYCRPDFSTGKWKCVLCDATNTNQEEYGDLSCAQFPEFHNKMVEYLEPSRQYYPGPDTPDPAYFFIVDSHLVQADVEILRIGILNVVKTLPDTSRIGLITFSSAISVYELGLPEVASAEVFPGENSLTTAEFMSLVDRQSNFVARVGQAAATIDRILTALVACAPQKRQVVQTRALGTALEIALALVTGEPKEAWQDANKESDRGRMDSKIYTGGQLFVFMTGSVNFGPGGIPDDAEDDMHKKNFYKEQATDYCRTLGMDAHRMNVVVDVFCCGLKNFYVKTLQNLVLSNGGSVIAQRDLHDSTFFPTLLLAAHRCSGRDGTFDIQCTSPVLFTHIIGPAIATTSTWQGRHSFRMGSVQSRVCYSLFCSLDDDIPADHIYFQFVMRYTNRNHQCITRVMTQRIATTGSMPTFFSSVNSDVVSTLLAKKIVLLSRKIDDDADVLDHLDRTVSNIVSSCGTKEKGGRNYTLPDTLSPIPKSLYLLRRGPMLAPILQHGDDIDFVRCLFLNSNLEDSLRLINPPLYLARPDRELERIPLEDLALQSRFVLLLDHHTDLFIWVGRQAPDSAKLVEQCRSAAASFAVQRFPQPQLMVFQEGASMARCLQVRLIPSHQDTFEEQKQSFPLIAEMGEKEYTAFVRRFHRTDELSFHHYFRSIISRLK